jgi:hypothetical protein
VVLGVVNEDVEDHAPEQFRRVLRIRVARL